MFDMQPLRSAKYFLFGSKSKEHFLECPNILLIFALDINKAKGFSDRVSYTKEMHMVPERFVFSKCNSNNVVILGNFIS